MKNSCKKILKKKKKERKNQLMVNTLGQKIHLLSFGDAEGSSVHPWWISNGF